MQVLVACEFSCAIRREYRALGHNACSCDLLPAEDDSPYHVQAKDTYKKLILKKGRLVGAILVGVTQKAGLFHVLIKKQIPVSDYVPLRMSKNLNFMDCIPLIRRYADRFTETEYKEIMDTGL